MWGLNSFTLIRRTMTAGGVPPSRVLEGAAGAAVWEQRSRHLPAPEVPLQVQCSRAHNSCTLADPLFLTHSDCFFAATSEKHSVWTNATADEQNAWLCQHASEGWLRWDYELVSLQSQDQRYTPIPRSFIEEGVPKRSSRAERLVACCIAQLPAAERSPEQSCSWGKGSRLKHLHYSFHRFFQFFFRQKCPKEAWDSPYKRACQPPAFGPDYSPPSGARSVK